METTQMSKQQESGLAEQGTVSRVESFAVI